MDGVTPILQLPRAGGRMLFMLWWTSILLMLSGSALLCISGSIQSVRRQHLQQAGPVPAGAGAQAYQPAAPAAETAVIPDLVLRDDKRGKDLHVRVHYPLDGGPFPVIVFSHGAGGSQDVAPELLSYWAAHGYVVISPTHDDSIMQRRKAGLPVSMTEVLKEFGSDPQLRVSRVADDKSIIDMLPQLPVLAPGLQGKIDKQHVGVGGHSAGAMTAMLLGGTRNDMVANGPGGIESADLSDKRISCTLVLSGQGISGTLGCFDEHSWDAVSLPMMVMTGSLDGSTRTGQTPQSRCDPYRYAPAGGKYLLYIEGAAHSSFVNSGAGKRALWQDWLLGADNSRNADAEDGQAIFSYVQQSSLAFWDAYLKHTAVASSWLESEAIELVSNGQVDYQWK